MRQFNGYKPTKPVSNEPLPAGGYVAKILKAECIGEAPNERLVLSFDIFEGQYKDFFADQYRNNRNEDRKWKGTFTIWLPKENGTDKDEWTKKTFNSSMWAIEDSNAGYHFNWDETTLKGKTVGVLFRNKEWAMNGRTGWTTECGELESVTNVREGKFKMPKDKPLPQKSDAQNAFASGGEYPSFVEVNGALDEDLPF